MSKYLFEIRNKFILLIITFFSTSLVCYHYKNVLLFLVTQMHLKDESLYFIFTDVMELFSVYFRLGFFLLIQVMVWYFFYHVFVFLCPALYLKELKFLTFCFKSATLFWLLAGLISSYVLIPFSWDFFLSFQGQKEFYFEAKISDYFTFYSNAYLLCLIHCQLLTVLFLFLVDIQQSYIYIKKYRKLYYYAFLIFSTFVTPPDLISQWTIAFIATIIYEIIIMFLTFNFLYKYTSLVTN